MKKFTLFSVVLSILVFSSANGANYLVRQDGTGDFSTLSDAVSFAMDGDYILVGPGTYDETFSIEKNLIIESESGRDVTILDGGEIHSLLDIRSGCVVEIRGITFSRAYGGDGSALVVWFGANATIEDCSFTQNFTYNSNAVYVRHSGTSAAFRRCEFSDNTAGLHSAALSMMYDATLIVEDCVFARNAANGHGTFNAIGGHVEFRNNVFWDNSGSYGAMTLEGGTSGVVSGNTFFGNNSSVASVGIFSPVVFEYNIVAGENMGLGLSRTSEGQFRYNLFYDNAGGDFGGESYEGEFVADPLFCIPEFGAFSVCADSPVLPENNSCCLIGALGVGCPNCGAVSGELVSWGSVKTLFR